MKTALGSLDVLQQDTRYAWRAILRSPGFTITVALTFALGVGLNSATFSVLDRIYLRPPDGVTDPGTARRVWFQQNQGGARQSLSFAANVGNATYSISHPYPMFRAMDQALDSLELAVIAVQSGRLGGTLRGAFTSLTFASANYFSLLGVRPARGRFYTVEEDRLGSGANVAVVSDRYWRAHLAGDTAIVGRTIRFGTTDYTVIGIAPRSFTGIELEPVDVWIPLGATPQDRYGGRLFEHPGMYTFRAFTRVADHADLAAIALRGTAAVQRSHRDLNGPVRAMTENLDRQYRPWRLGATLFSAFGLLALVVAVLGVYSTVSYSVSQRTQEFGVRMALGAQVRDVLNLVLGEGLRVIGIGVVVGIALVLATGKVIAALLYGVEPSNPGTIIAMSLALLVAGGIAALLPAWRGAQVDPSIALRQG